jgi:RNA polymerase sigma-70 factor, ECF subfamily
VQQALVDRAQSGDEEAFTVLARAAGDGLLSIAYRILRDLSLAEDAVQQTLVIAWRELPSLRDPDRFDAWLHRLLVNACYAEARRARLWRANVRLLVAEPAAGTDDVAAVALRDELERAFRRVSPEQRAVFVFHHYLGLNLAEIADELGVPIGTVKSRLHYATSSLRAAVEADGRSIPTPAERPA